MKRKIKNELILAFVLGCLVTSIPIILSQGPIQSHPASEIVSGTFGGNYVFQNGLDLNGDLDMNGNSILNVNQLNGGTPYTSANDCAADQVRVAGTCRNIPDCDADTQTLNYDQGTDTFSCLTDDVGAGGDITGVTAGSGLTGGGTSDGVTLDVGAGTGISVAADSVSLDTTYTDNRYVNEGQANSITSGMITDGQVTSSDVNFNYAGSTSKGGAASNVACSACISESEIVQNSLDDSEIQDDSLTAVSLAADSVGASELVASYESGSAYDSRFVNAGENLRVIRGVIESDGITIRSGSGFSAQKLGGAGDYRITFDTAFSDIPAVTITVESTIDKAAKIADGALRMGGFDITIFVTSSGMAQGSAYSFIAIGPN